MSRVLSCTESFGGHDPSVVVPMLVDHDSHAARVRFGLAVDETAQCEPFVFSGSPKLSGSPWREGAADIATVLAACPYAALACDDSARLIACNLSASALLRDGVSMAGGRLTMSDALVHKRFLKLLHAPADAAPAALLVPRPSGRASLQMLVSEIPARVSRVLDHRVQRLWKVVMSDPSHIAPACVQAFASLYGMTPAEVRLAQQLLLGATLQEAAARAQVKVSTVRSQLNTLLRKTGTRRQAELVRVLSVVPA